MKKIVVFTSGGDSPGMNGAIRAVVRSGIYYGLEVMGSMRGYNGLINNDLIPMNAHSVSNIIQRGGTILKTARSKEFMTPEGRQKAYDNLVANGIDGMVAIGGDGTYTGAMVFYKEHKIPTIGIPGTIDNDLYGTDYTIGFDTAVNTALDAIDKIRDTADSHDRLFLVEVMGRDTGYIAMEVGIAGGAEAILVPESKTNVQEFYDLLENGLRRHKTSFIVVVAEGDELGNAHQIAKYVGEKYPQFDTKVSILGHIQRGGKPSARDRVLGSRLGMAAVQALRNGQYNQAAGIVDNQVVYTDFQDAITKDKKINRNLFKLVDILG